MEHPPPPDAAAPKTLPRGPCFWHAGHFARAACRGCGRPLCAECGVAVSVDDPPEPAEACPTCAPLFGVRSSVPFEDPRGFASFWRTWWWALVGPQRLFAAFPRQGTGRATAFACLTWLPATVVLSTCVGLFILALSGAFGQPGRGDVGLALVVAGSVVWGIFALTPLIVLAVALPLHVVVLMAGGEGGFTATYRLLCYLAGVVAAAAPVVVVGGGFLSTVVPCGVLLVLAGAEVWHGWALYHAVRRVHGLGPGMAALAALVPFVVRCVFAGGFVALTLVPSLL